MAFSRISAILGFLACSALFFSACGGDAARVSSSSAGAVAAQAPAPEPAPPPAETGGFDGAKAFAHVEKLVSFGPRPPASEGIHRAQEYIRALLQSFGCAVEEDDFHASTPAGSVAMKNIVAKSPGAGSGILLLLTHYDTVRVENFVGAEDGGSSTGLMLEMARLLCARKHPMSIWIGFLDGEEAFVQWSDSDSVYGSRELAARMAISGDLKRIKAVILADMIGQTNLRIPRETNSTPWLNNLVWSTAARLGYKDVFVSGTQDLQDDHLPFLHRGVPAVDLIDYSGFQQYWHTPQDTLDKVSPRSLAIVGHVILDSLAALEKKFQ